MVKFGWMFINAYWNAGLLCPMPRGLRVLLSVGISTSIALPASANGYGQPGDALHVALLLPDVAFDLPVARVQQVLDGDACDVRPVRHDVFDAPSVDAVYNVRVRAVAVHLLRVLVSVCMPLSIPSRLVFRVGRGEIRLVHPRQPLLLLLRARLDSLPLLYRPHLPLPLLIPLLPMQSPHLLHLCDLHPPPPL